jgi:hypothetical protein
VAGFVDARILIILLIIILIILIVLVVVGVDDDVVVPATASPSSLTPHQVQYMECSRKFAAGEVPSTIA